MPRFSVIVPAHNTEQYIEECLRSVRQQTFTDYELFVVCDSCIDNTANIAKQYADRVDIVRYRMDGPTRNFGLNIAHGEYILFLDSDDYFYDENVFETIDKKLKDENNPDVLCLPFVFNGDIYAGATDDNGNYWTACWTKCWKRQTINNTRFVNAKHSDVKFTEDMLHKREIRIVKWDRLPLYFYNYKRPDSITQLTELGKW